MCIPENRQEALNDALEVIDAAPSSFAKFFEDKITLVIENCLDIWPEDGETGVGFFASFHTLWADASLNTKSRTVTLREIVETHYLNDDDSGWEEAERLGFELKRLAEELLESAARGKVRWPNESASQ